MFITNGREIQIIEGITQGNLLAMAMYAISTLTLINKLKENCPDVKQAWYADDVIRAATCHDLISW